MGVADIVLGVMVIALFVLGFMMAVFVVWLVLLGLGLVSRKAYRTARTRHNGDGWY